MKYLNLLLLLLIMGITPLLSQTTQALVSIREDTGINEAIQILEIYSQRETAKKIINLSSFSGAVGIPLNNLGWHKALELIALRNNLRIFEKAGVFCLEDISMETASSIAAASESNTASTKQVKIKAVALLADRAYMRALGIDWSTLLNGKVTIDAGFLGSQEVAGSLFNLGASRLTTWNGNTIEVNTLLKTIESDQKGSVIAQPVLTVSSGKRGFIQVGQDISVKTTDEAGNTTDTFFATGVILDVLPTIFTVDGKDLIHLVLRIERSTGTPGAVSTIINKTMSTTELVLYDGEESVVGGLYDTDEIHSRGGIPFLRNLPWWVFGIRYLTGYDKIEKKERELMLLLKVDIVEDALSRAKKAQEVKKVQY